MMFSTQSGVPYVVFSFWLGDIATMSGERLRSLLAIQFNINAPFQFIPEANLEPWILTENPLHPAYPFLSKVHQNDYLRMYFLHHYGGGYTDIKPPSRGWRDAFKKFEQSGMDIAGYSELRPTSVAQLPGQLGQQLRENYSKVLGVCCLIARPLTSFSIEWKRRVHAYLDENLEDLKRFPARDPADFHKKILANGNRSNYPLAWTGVGGDILHPLMLEMADQLLHVDIAPAASQYK
jgi:hypothetical protein